MRLARILGAVGRALISAGVIVLLFVAYQLWGTGLQHAQAQNNLENDFLELLESDVAAEAETINEQVAALGGTDGAPSDSSENPDEAEAVGQAELREFDLNDIEYSPQFLSQLYPEEGSSLARIVIAEINVDQIVVEGVSVEDLRKGPGHYRSTPNPGQAGNAAIAGHRTTYGAPFHRIDELDPGDEIIVTTLQGSFVYRVRENVMPDGNIRGHFIVSPSDTWVLDQGDENLLTLTACHPKYSARQRIVVQAELVGEPAITIPRDDPLGELPPIELSSGAEDERAQDPLDDSNVVVSEDVARDDDAGEFGGGDGSSIDDGSGAQVVVADSNDSDSGTDATQGATSDEVELTSAQAPFETDFGEGLNGDRSKVRPAIMWGLAGFFIWMTAWFAGKRLNRKWTLYFVGLTPFALVLWACFVNVDQALPSY